MKKHLVSSQIKNLTTGKSTDVPPFYLMRECFDLNTFVKILRVQSFFNREDKSREILIDCLALDSCGFVFKLTMTLAPKCIEEQRKMLLDITIGRILAVRGGFSVLPENEGGICLLDPKYEMLPAEYRPDDIEEVFRMNNLTDKSRLI